MNGILSDKNLFYQAVQLQHQKSKIVNKTMAQSRFAFVK
jgi:hypothetical protein